MDKNKDGVLTKEEIIESYRNVYGTIDPDIVENMIKSIDLDGNGVIDYNKNNLYKRNRYEGEYKNNLREGKGVYYIINGDKCEGYFKKYIIKGIFYFINGNR